MGHTRSRTTRSVAPRDAATDGGQVEAVPRVDAAGSAPGNPQRQDEQSTFGAAGVRLLFEGLFSCLRRGSRRL